MRILRQQSHWDSHRRRDGRHHAGGATTTVAAAGRIRAIKQLVAQRTPSRPTAAGWSMHQARRLRELRVQPPAVAKPLRLPPASNQFSDDSMDGVLIGFTEEQEAKLRRRKSRLAQLGLLGLATGRQTTIEGINRSRFRQPQHGDAGAGPDETMARHQYE